ncbi:MAG: GGDEF domain-containing protein [bacterium]
MTSALLYRWSTAAQLVSVLMIGLFYLTLARSIKRAEVVWWAQGWWFNFAAMTLTLVYWVASPPALGALVLRSLYVGGKMAFALLLVQGAWALRRAGAQWLSRKQLAFVICASVVFAAVFLPGINLIGVGAQGTMGALFIWCGVLLLRDRKTVPAWLALGFLARGSFAIVESVAYAASILPGDTFSPERSAGLALFLGAHSSLDLAAEWLLALGGVLAITHRGQEELQATNDNLLAAHEELRRLADRDPLTGLANRRALPESFRTNFETGAAIAFFDLDDFKAINDTIGHIAGDACLNRFADALRSSFRPGDTIVRYAGDEFVVVAGGMSIDMAHTRVARMRETLSVADDVALEFSVGVVALEKRGDADAALRAADDAMYLAKTAVV